MSKSIREPMHLGDGAYVSLGRYEGEVVITANHHDPAQASDVVYLDPYAVNELRIYLESVQSGGER